MSESGATKKYDTVCLDAVCEWTLVDKTLETQADTKNAHKLTYHLNKNPLKDLKRLKTAKNNNKVVQSTFMQHPETAILFFLNFL